MNKTAQEQYVKLLAVHNMCEARLNEDYYSRARLCEALDELRKAVVQLKTLPNCNPVMTLRLNFDRLSRSICFRIRPESEGGDKEIKANAAACAAARAAADAADTFRRDEFQRLDQERTHNDRLERRLKAEAAERALAADACAHSMQRERKARDLERVKLLALEMVSISSLQDDHGTILTERNVLLVEKLLSKFPKLRQGWLQALGVSANTASGITCDAYCRRVMLKVHPDKHMCKNDEGWNRLAKLVLNTAGEFTVV